MQKRILIVDDNDDFRKVVRDSISREFPDIDLYEASCGVLGKAKALSKRPDVIVMDIRMPKMNGLQAANEIKKEYPKCKIIVLTMFNPEEFQTQCCRDTVMQVIGKNEIFDQLIPAVREALELSVA